MKENKNSNWRTNLRIVWAITAKDILEAVKNRYALSVVITALFIVVAYSFIPTLTSLDNPTNVLVYDASNSSLGTQLKGSQALEVYTYKSEEAMLEKLAGGEVPELGLVIPAGYDTSMSSTEGSQNMPSLTGYVLFWVNQKEIAQLTRDAEAEITSLTGAPVQIQVSEQRIIPDLNQNMLGTWVSAALVFMLIYISLGLLANLMLEEKQTRTLDVLLVSPASSWHVVAAKAITGLFYCMLGVAVAFAINYKIVLHWWLLLPSLIIGALFAISLGLIAGSLVEERGQLSLWTFGLIIPLFVPVFLSFMNELFPEWLNQIIRLIPTVTLDYLVLASFSELPPLSTLLGQFAWLLAWTIAGLATTIWILRRQQQRKETGNRGNLVGKIRDERSREPTRESMPALSSTGNSTAALSYAGIQALGSSTAAVKPASGLRIAQAIAFNDIRQSIHNKIILSILLGTTLLVAGNAVLLRGLSALSGGQANLAESSVPVFSMMISISLMALGISLVPLLMIEEKETHTLETLLVSPAGYMQVVAGKALAGSVYCLSGALVMLVAYNNLIAHWGVALLALALATAFVVAIGLLVGIISDSPTTIGLWAVVVMIILIIPTVMAGLSSLDRIPWIEQVLTYWPSTAIVNLFNLAMVKTIPQGVVIKNAAVVASASLVLYLLTWWLVRRSDR